MRLRVAAIRERLEQEHVVASYRLHDRRRLRVVHPHRLLAEHMLPGLGGRHRPLSVHGMRQPDEDDVDRGVRHHGVVSAVPREFELGRECGRAFDGAAADVRQLPIP